MLTRIAVGLVGGVACVLLSLPPPSSANRVTLGLLPNPLVLKVLARGQIDFVADLFWVRMANMAGMAETPVECAALIPIGNLIADLAPKFQYSYFVGGVMAPVRRGRSEEYDNAPEAIALLARGIDALPRYGRLYLQKSYSELVMMHDPVSAAHTLQAMAAQPGAPAHVAPLAARLLAQGGRFEAAREFARTMLDSEDPHVRADAEVRLKQIDLEQTLTQIDKAVKVFTAQEGRAPQHVYELIQRGLLSEVPTDPFGGDIELGPDGAHSTTNAGRLRAFIPREE